MKENAYTALRRYEAMAGRLQGGPAAVARQAESDRARYGDRYLWTDRNGDFALHPVLKIRFLVEVCGIPLREARDAVREDCAATGVDIAAAPSPPPAMARRLFDQLGDVFAARETAAFFKDLFHDREGMPAYWDAVIDHIETAAFVPEDTGIENWADGND